MKIHVKICGITNLEDAIVAAEAGADLLGFIFYASSPRHVTLPIAVTIAEALREKSRSANTPLIQDCAAPKLVGVFVNQSPDQIAHIIDTVGLDYAQLHGDEPPAFVANFAGRAYKAVRPHTDQQDLESFMQYAALGPPGGPALLVDAYTPDAYGGTGVRADWDLAARIARQTPGTLLAGGLAVENISEAIQEVRPWGVDVSSGVERRPGQKSHESVRAFVTHVRKLSAQLES